MLNKLSDITMFQNIDVSKIQYSSKIYQEKNIIRLAGDVSNTFGVILSGEAVIEHINLEGQLMTVASFKAGSTIGGNRMFASDPAFSMTVSAKKITTILFVSKETVLSLCQSDQNFLEHFLKDIADKSDLLSHRIRSLKFVSIEDQIISFLKKEKEENNSMIFDLKISKIEWAEKMGIQRTSLSRALQKMKKKEWILYKNHHFELINANIFN